ncbi:hypothetical protein MtrunA17_Chr3g0120971 [Medicago truncatula]|uniref:Transmembrane protein n=1 Tax=Medicago truncatula TaxID=3880 RepID=A0A396ITR2_MEDTR|nr:hypothetical protein MtrunA17_Chr3g0120971 [Medicago truncatula]
MLFCQYLFRYISVGVFLILYSIHLILLLYLDSCRFMYGFNIESIVDADDDRFNYFVKKGGIMIFASSYFEFIRIRIFLKSQNASFCLLGE